MKYRQLNYKIVCHYILTSICSKKILECVAYKSCLTMSLFLYLNKSQRKLVSYNPNNRFVTNFNWIIFKALKVDIIYNYFSITTATNTYLIKICFKANAFHNFLCISPNRFPYQLPSTDQK